MNIGGYEYWRSNNLPVDRVSYIVGRTDQKYDKRDTKNCVSGLALSQNRDIVALVHKNLSYVECARYSCNILLIYLKV
jgi:hypothetical protein